MCNGCVDGSDKIFEQFCVSICPRGFSANRHLDNIYCEKCDIEKLKVVDTSTGQCVCANRHYWN